jgi:hypothetical protein
MSRARTTPGRKAAEQILDALNRKDFSRYEFAEILTKTVSPEEYVTFAMAVIEIGAVYWDHGLFDSQDRDWLRTAARLRDVYTEEMLDRI